MEVLKIVETPSNDETKTANAVIVKNTENRFYIDYEGYYLVDRDTLFIIDGDSEVEVEKNLKTIIDCVSKGIDISAFVDDKFVLSTKSL